jgi:hypothetical protein
VEQTSFIERARAFTLDRIVFGDMLLNWFLGAVMLLFPGAVDRLLAATSPLLPSLVYRVVGIGFLLFAAWQTWVVVRHVLGPRQLVFAGILAEVPFLMLTAALVFANFDLKLFWRLVLWVGNIYMLLLGGWYFYLAAQGDSSDRATVAQ